MTDAKFPNGVTKVNDSTMNNVGKIISEFGTYLKSAKNDLVSFNKTVDTVSLTLRNFKKEYDKQHSSSEKDLMRHMGELSDSVAEESKEFKNYLRTVSKGKKDDNDIVSQFGRMMDSNSRTEKDPYKELKSQIKSETEQNKIKYLDSKYSDLNKNIKLNNDYYGELEKLKLSALDAFGKNFEGTAEYKNALKKMQGEFDSMKMKLQFQTESENNQIKYLNSKYNDLDKMTEVSNNYYQELEKLKSGALEAYGKGFESNEVYKNALMKLQTDFSSQVDTVNKDYIKQSFSEETERNKVKYLDNEYAVGNNVSKQMNKYYSDLETLKSNALDTYGEGFESNKDYQKALMNLNNTHDEEMKEARKQDFKENHKILSEMSEGLKNTFDRNEKSLQGMLGPLNLFMAPLQDFFGGISPIFKWIGGGIKGLFKKFTKKKPTSSDVAKSGALGTGSLYLGNKLDELLGKKSGGGLGDLGDLFGGGGLMGLLKGMGGGLAGIGPLLLKAGGIAMIAGSLIWATIDGIKGYIMSEDWGVSKISGFLGGFFAGTGEGIKNAFANAGKWALMGAGVGMLIAPPIGALVGGLAGAAIGGLLGFIGGKRLAKGFDAIGKWFKEKIWEPIKEFFFNVFDIEKFKEIWKGDGSILTKIGKTIGQGLITLVKMPFSLLINGGKLAIKIGKNLLDTMISIFSKIWEKIKEYAPIVWKGIKDFFGGLWNGIKSALASTWKGIKEGWSKTKKAVSKIWKKMKEGVPKAWNKIKEGLAKAWEGIKNLLSKAWEKMKEGVPKAWNKIKEGLAKAWEGIKEKASAVWEKMKQGASDAWDNIKNLLSKVWDKIVEPFNNIKEDFARDGIKGVVDGIFTRLKEKVDTFFKTTKIGQIMDTYIITPVKNFFNKIGSFFSYIGTMWDEKGGIRSLDDIWAGLKEDKSGKSTFSKYAEKREYASTEWAKYKKSTSSVLNLKGFSDKEISDAIALKMAEDGSNFYTAREAVLKEKKIKDAILRPDGTIIHTDPKDTLVALKDIPFSMSQVKNDMDKDVEYSVKKMGSEQSSGNMTNGMEKKLTVIADILNKILSKDAVQVNLPQQTRAELDILMNGGAV